MVAHFLIETEQNLSWQNTHKSYSSWLLDVSKELQISESNLWRYINAAKFIISHILKDADNPKILDQFIGIPHSISPENIELIEKISRSAPSQYTERLIKRLLKNNLRRDELRAIWNDFKGLLDGHDARGRDIDRPILSLNNKERKVLLFERIFYHELKRKPPIFFGLCKKTKMRILSINPSFQPIVMLTLLNDNYYDEVLEVSYHELYFLKHNQDQKTVLDNLYHVNEADYVWIVVEKSLLINELLNELDKSFGIIQCDDNDLKLVKEPDRNPLLNMNNDFSKRIIASILNK